MAEQRFPILPPRGSRYVVRDPHVRDVPWELVEPLRDVAQQVHGQTLERLAERGGLSRFELGCLLVGIDGAGAPFRPVLDGQHSTMPVLALVGES